MYCSMVVVCAHVYVVMAYVTNTRLPIVEFNSAIPLTSVRHDIIDMRSLGVQASMNSAVW